MTSSSITPSRGNPSKSQSRTPCGATVRHRKDFFSRASTTSWKIRRKNSMTAGVFWRPFIISSLKFYQSSSTSPSLAIALQSAILLPKPRIGIGIRKVASSILSAEDIEYSGKKTRSLNRSKSITGNSHMTTHYGVIIWEYLDETAKILVLYQRSHQRHSTTTCYAIPTYTVNMSYMHTWPMYPVKILSTNWKGDTSLSTSQHHTYASSCIFFWVIWTTMNSTRYLTWHLRGERHPHWWGKYKKAKEGDYHHQSNLDKQIHLVKGNCCGARGLLANSTNSGLMIRQAVQEAGDWAAKLKTRWEFQSDSVQIIKQLRRRHAEGIERRYINHPRKKSPFDCTKLSTTTRSTNAPAINLANFIVSANQSMFWEANSIASLLPIIEASTNYSNDIRDNDPFVWSVGMGYLPPRQSV